MCPVCLANLAFIAAGAGSTSGLTALAVKKFFSNPNRNYQPNETGEEHNENRNDGTKDKGEGNKSFQSGVRS